MISVTAEEIFSDNQSGKRIKKKVDLKVCENSDFETNAHVEKFKKLVKVLRNFRLKPDFLCFVNH